MLYRDFGPDAEQGSDDEDDTLKAFSNFAAEFDEIDHLLLGQDLLVETSTIVVVVPLEKIIPMVVEDEKVVILWMEKLFLLQSLENMLSPAADAHVGAIELVCLIAEAGLAC